MLLNDTGRNAANTGGVGNLITYVGLSTLVGTQTLPDDAGGQEVAGGTYARLAVAWAASAAGVRANSGALTFNVPPSTTIAALTFHTALTVGTYIGNSPLNTTKSRFGTCAAADVTANTITSAGHGFTNGNRVFGCNLNGLALPTGLAENILYWVVGAASETFQLANSLGGAAIDITGSGGGALYIQDLIPEPYASAGTLTVAIGALTLDESVL